MYTTLGSNRLEQAIPFYDGVLGSMGWRKLFDSSRGGRFYGNDNNEMFAILAPFDKQGASAGNGTMIGFFVKSRAEVDAVHAKALSLGGTCEGKPGIRGPEEGGAYFAYFRDLDGNKLCAYNWTPAAK